MFYINEKTNMFYTGDLQPGDRVATEQEVAEALKDKRSYKEKRLSKYPSIGDMIDAFCKAKSGDESELNNLMQLRENIKKEFPKE